MHGIYRIEITREIPGDFVLSKSFCDIECISFHN